MTTVIINNNVRTQSTKQTVRNVVDTFMKNYDSGTIDLYMQNQNFSDAHLVQFCKAANINCSGMSKDEKLTQVCAYLKKNRQGVIDYIEMVGSSGELLIAGMLAVMTLLTLIVRQVNKFSFMTSTSFVGNDSADLFVTCVTIMFIWCLCNACRKHSSDVKEYKNSIQYLKGSWNNLKTTYKRSKRKRTSSVRRMAETAKHVHNARTRAQLAKTRKKMKSCNSFLGKLKRVLCGGHTHVDLQKQAEKLEQTLAANQ